MFIIFRHDVQYHEDIEWQGVNKRDSLRGKIATTDKAIELEFSIYKNFN